MTAPRVWILDEEWPDVTVETDLVLAAHPDAQVRHSGYAYDDDLAAFGRTCDVILAQVYADLPAATIDALERCRGIAVMGGGFDRVDVAAATRRGIPVCNVQGYCTEDIAQYVLTAVLEWLKPLRPAAVDVPWGLQAYPELPRRAAGLTLLVVGLGRIGRVVARRAAALGLRVLAADPYVDDEAFDESGAERVDLRDGLARADVVSLHCSLTPETRGLVGPDELALVPPGALLVNTARGAVADEAALIAALESGRLSAAVLDVVAHEPPDFTEPVFAAPRATVTPHVSYASAQSLAELRSRCVSNALAMLQGALPADCVNADELALAAASRGPSPEEGDRS